MQDIHSINFIFCTTWMAQLHLKLHCKSFIRAHSTWPFLLTKNRLSQLQSGLLLKIRLTHKATLKLIWQRDSKGIWGSHKFMYCFLVFYVLFFSVLFPLVLLLLVLYFYNSLPFVGRGGIFMTTAKSTACAVNSTSYEIVKQTEY